ncbi:MAG: hypothetical protein H7249_15140 [Chitinophagaceae bacterium]|nr:hypothetical protein [Oligoflexus sp.]
MSTMLTACVSTGELHARNPPDVLQRRVQTWLGMPRDFLEKHWGIAQDTKDMGAGLRYLEYTPKPTSKREKPVPAEVCHVVFTVDITGTVRGGQWSGNRSSCLNFVKEVPQIIPKQILVTN